MNEKIRVGIFGGTFNPPHLAHVKAAECFCEAIKPDELLIIPDFLPPHKAYSGTVTPEQRLEMCKLAFGHIPCATVSDMEIKRGGKSYTADTLSILSSEEKELYFLCGTDMLLTMDSWYSPQTIFSLATICCIRRESDVRNTELISLKAKEYREKFGAKIILIPCEAYQLSSSEARAAVVHGGHSQMLPNCVFTYIEEKGLYR